MMLGSGLLIGCLALPPFVFDERPPSFKTLITDLKSGDLRTRRQAVVAVGSLADRAGPVLPALIQILINTLGDQDQYVQDEASHALAGVGACRHSAAQPGAFKR
jgi:HEAT repeat protein